MGKQSSIVHQYFRKELEDGVVLVRLNPIQLLVMELWIPKEGQIGVREFEVDAEILEDLNVDGFSEASPLEFNLYLTGLAGSQL